MTCLFFAKSPTTHGFGVFSTTAFLRGTVIEEYRVFPFSAPDYVMKDALSDYRLAWSQYEDVMASGYACLYNHSDDPNVALEYEKEQVLIRVRTLRDITCGEELFKRYACAPWWRP